MKPGKAGSNGGDNSDDSENGDNSDDDDDDDDDGDCCGGNADRDNGTGGGGCGLDDGGGGGGDGEVELASMFKVGQYLRAYVLHSTEEVMVAAAASAPRIKKRIELSLEPKLANASLSAPDLCTGYTVQASVVSVEDHGLVMDLGLSDPGLKGFLSSRELGNSLSLSEAKEGQVLLCTVTCLSANRQVVQLSADLEQRFTDKDKLQADKPSWWLSQASSIHAFLPGTGAEVLVSRVGRNGIAGSIMGMLDAVADYFHVAGWDPKALEKRVKVGSKVKSMRSQGTRTIILTHLFRLKRGLPLYCPLPLPIPPRKSVSRFCLTSCHWLPLPRPIPLPCTRSPALSSVQKSLGLGP